MKDAQDSVMGNRAYARKLGQMRADRKGNGQRKDVVRELNDIAVTMIEAVRVLRLVVPVLRVQPAALASADEVRAVANRLAFAVHHVQWLVTDLQEVT